MQELSLKALAGAYGSLDGQSVKVCGWIRTVRDSKNFAFIEINDGTYFKSTQIVADASLANYKEITALNVGAAIYVVGKVIVTPEMKQPYEVRAESVEIAALSTPDYPLQKKRHTMEYLREIAHLRPRSNTFLAVFKVRSVAAQAIHSFFASRDFVYVNTPIVTCSDCEGAGDMFRITTLDAVNPPMTDDGKVDYSKDFFCKPANLTVSGQLNAECYALAFRNVYTFGPTFRAEKSYTNRHAAEFWMIEPEMAFADLNVDMEVIEAMLKYVISDVMAKCPEELAFFDKFVEQGLIAKLKDIVNKEFAKVTYTEAVDILTKSKEEFQYPVFWGADLQTEHERYLTEKVFKRPTFVTDYPKDIKAFYMRLNDDNKTVAAVDLLVPQVGEIVGGSQREERLDMLKARMSDLGLREEDYWWYLDLRRYGGVKHAGFGLGFERLIMYMTGMQNIRDVIPFPRTTGNSEF
ncbi:MAG: asparagine--tRNA ligase [Clostridia bacterium]|nr:asparagine--tRNA ligase [Clostridia bacterium]